MGVKCVTYQNLDIILDKTVRASFSIRDCLLVARVLLNNNEDNIFKDT